MKIYSSLFVFTTFFIAALYAKTNILVRIQKIICTVHDHSVKIEICSVKPVNRTTTLLNVAGNYTRPVETLLINSQLYKKSEIKYRPFLVNVTDDYCAFFTKNKAGPYLRIVWPIVMQYTNMNHKCPYSGYHYFKDLPVDSEKVPSVWPNGNYRLDILFHEANINKLITSELYFEIKQRPLF